MRGGSYTRRAMSLRLITVLVAALALWPAAAFAQEPTATPGPPDSASDAVKLIYEDYRRDGKIDVCDHERADLAGRAGHDRARLRHRLPGLPRGDRGRHHSATTTGAATTTRRPRRPPPRPRRPPRPPPRTTARCRRPTTTAAPTTARSRRRTTARATPEDGDASARGDPRRTRRSPPTDAGPQRADRRRRRRPAAPAVPTPAIVSTKADGSKLLIPGILVALAIIGALALVIFGRRSPAWREAAFRIPRNVGGFHRLAAPRAMTV